MSENGMVMKFYCFNVGDGNFFGGFMIFLIQGQLMFHFNLPLK